MGIAYNFKCDKCGCETYLEAENDFQKVLICENCAECYVVEQRKEKPQPNIPHCPTCNSTKIKRISGTAKVAGALTFGIFSKTARSQFKCENCGYKW